MLAGDSLPAFMNDSTLQKCIQVFQYFVDNPEHKTKARQHPLLGDLFESARKALFPSKQELKMKRNERRKQLVAQDHEKLALTQLRQDRKKCVGYANGSLTMGPKDPLPPRVGTLESNEEYVRLDDDALLGKVMDQVQDFHLELPQRKLNFARSCHICGGAFKYLDHFYDQLCPSCAKLNHLKRNAVADLKGRVCLVTGARVKIGYCVAIKLLRMGATVIATSRFPHDAAYRFSQEPDFMDFKQRLYIYGLDFRDVNMVHYFTDQLKKQFDRLDIIINNAAQTVRRPPKYYQHLLCKEMEPIPKSISDYIQVIDVHKSGQGYLFLSSDSSLPNVEQGLVAGSSHNGAGAPASVLLSQLKLIDEDHHLNTAHFPPGLYDKDDQQIDLRVSNSWTAALGDISTVEMMECHMINTFAPWIIISECLPLMRRTESCNKYIVNVSAMEGQFYRPKSHLHPHTNMAKGKERWNLFTRAALNMLTRTASAGLAAQQIFMTAVDTGWITDENPLDQWENRAMAPPPLDEWDAAMRILDPVIRGIHSNEQLWGVFLKNYIPTRW